MIIVLIFEGRIKIGKMWIISTKNNKNQTNSKGVIRISKSKKDRQNNEKKSTKEQTII